MNKTRFKVIYNGLLLPKKLCPGCGTNLIHEINCPTIAAIVALRELEEEEVEKEKILDKTLFPLFIIS